MCASTNPGKVAELVDILRPLGVSLLPRPADLPDVEEDADTLEGNALLKASAVLKATGQPALADDSGLFVDALEGKPGVRTARYAGEPADPLANMTKLLAALRKAGAMQQDQRTARFVTVIVALWPDGGRIVATGTAEGRIAMAPRGSGGFGYDPIFVPEGADGRTFAELPSAAKHGLSHRGRALSQLGALLGERGAELG